MKLNFDLNQHQKLVMTQKMQLSIKILQMSNIELKDYIEKKIQENPVLESKYDKDCKIISEYLKIDESINKNNMKVNNISENFNKFEEVSVFNFIGEKTSLKDFLNNQLLDLNESIFIKKICEYIIGNINSNGYLDSSAKKIANELKVDETYVKKALNIVQNLEPAGIACRNLSECLKIQLMKKGIKNPDIYLIVEKYLILLADNKINEISKKLKISLKKVQEYVDIIKTLEPKPSRGFYTGEDIHYIIPEAYIKKVGQDYHIIMNEGILPLLNISKLYVDIIKNKELKNEKTYEYIKNKIEDANFLIKSINKRKTTVYKIIETIILNQKDFLKYGWNKLKPMTLKDVAKTINVHVSTISRAIKDKYIYIDNIGTVKIKNLFVNSTAKDIVGQDVSSIKLKNMIKKCIENEDKKKPLSDQKICMMILDNGMNISRRTVAKYREELGIKSSSKRKRF